MAAQGEGRLAGPRVPDAHRPPPAGRDESHSIGAEGHAVDRVHGLAVDAELAAVGDVPGPQRPVAADGGELEAVGTERHTVDGAVMPAEAGDLPTGRGVP